MLNSKKPIKVAWLQKLTNHSEFNRKLREMTNDPM